MGAKRYLIVTADDYGIGPATSQGILELAAAGRVSAAVLMINSPYAEAAVRAWREVRDLRSPPSQRVEHGRAMRDGFVAGYA